MAEVEGDFLDGDLVGIAGGGIGDDAGGSGTLPGEDVERADGADIFFLDVIDDDGRAGAEDRGEFLVGELAVKASFPGGKFLAGGGAVRTLGGDVTHGDGDAAKLVRKALEVDPVGVDGGVDQAGSGEAGHVHAVGDVGHPEAGESIEDGGVLAGGKDGSGEVAAAGGEGGEFFGGLGLGGKEEKAGGQEEAGAHGARGWEEGDGGKGKKQNFDVGGKGKRGNFFVKRYLGRMQLKASLMILGGMLAGSLGAEPAPEQGPPPPVATFYESFLVTGSKIVDPTGKEFLIRGVSLQYGDNPAEAIRSFGPIAEAGANLVRILWWEADNREHGQPQTTVEEMEASIAGAVAAGLVAMPEFHGATCSGKAKDLRRVVDRWVEVAGVLAKPYYAQHMLLNIANEWGHIDMPRGAYVEEYSEAIRRLRAAGYRNLLVIDASHCGQDIRPVVDGGGHRLLGADPLRRVVFSAHAYNWLWDTPEEMEHNLTLLWASGLPYIFGEYGSREFDGVDDLWLRERCAQLGIGWIAWSWKGNGGEAAVLDMSKRYEAVDLTAYGERVVHGPHGLRAEAVKAPRVLPYRR